MCCLLQQIEYLTAQYTTAKNKVLSDLDSKLNSDSLHSICLMSLIFPLNRLISLCFLTDIGPLLGGRIHSKLEKEVVPSLDTALRMAGGKTHTVLAFNVTSCSVQTAEIQYHNAALMLLS